MRRNFLILASLIILATNVMAVDLVIDSINYTPSPAIPGRYLTLYAHVKNNSNRNAEDSIFILNLEKEAGEGTYPFSLDPDESSTKNLGTIRPGQTALVEYRIKVDADALSGNYTINLEFGDEGSVDKRVKQSIIVLGREPQIEIINSSLSEAVPGEKIDIDLTLRNIGYEKATDILVGLEEDRTVTSTGVVVERDISPLGASFYFIESMLPDTQAIARISLGINPDTEQKIYMVPITLKYKDENANDYSITRYIGLKVSQPGELDAVISEASPTAYPGGTSEITIDLFNIGAGDAKYVVAELNTAIGEISQTKNFIGTLEDDDFDSFKTTIKINNNVSVGEQPITLTLTYKTEFGETETVVKTLYLKVLSQEEAAALTAEPISIWFYVVVLIVLFFVGRWIYRKIRKPKN